MASTEQPTNVLPRTEGLDTECLGASRPAREWREGQRIGAFKLVRRLGKGGMGQVWLAHQLQPLIRDVALKVMLPERRSARAEAFFEVERQALALLSHRAVAQIYDAGRLPDGALYFAMEYVPGRPLDEFLRLRPQPLPSLVRLFIDLCGGIQHAHQRGLIHRDLKPQNVLVQDTEAGPLPRIIDFGIALGSSGDGITPMQPSQVAGTPAYMAPEQREPAPAGIDARCDIYALGLMLAECLRQQAGLSLDSRAPDSTALRSSFIRSMKTPVPPEGDAQQLRRVPFELRAIALKAMAEDRDQRYASAASMAEDLQRWLQREPVLAVAGGRSYVLRCFLRRNALATAAASFIGLALIGGTGLALYGLEEARAGRAQAEAAQALAEQRRAEAEQLIQYMLGDLADKLRPLGRLDLLDSIGAEALKYLGEADTRGDAASHLARARALRTLGEVAATRQQFERARLPLERAARHLDWALAAPEDSVEELHFEAGQVAFWQGQIAYWQSDLNVAQRHWKDYMRHAQAFAAATSDFERGQQELAYAHNNLGTAEYGRSQLIEALKHFEQAAAIRRELRRESVTDSMTLALVDTLSWIGQTRVELGQPHEAIESLQAGMELLSRHFSDSRDASSRRRAIDLRFVLAQVFLDLGRATHAEAMLDSALVLARADAANDPTQPRRQIKLAHIAFKAARIQSKPLDVRIRALREGTAALEPLLDSPLPQHERAHALVEACSAQVSLDLADAHCIDSVLASLEAFGEAEAQRLAHPLTELAARVRTNPGLAQLSREFMARVPEPRRQSLRHKLSEAALMDTDKAASAEAIGLRAEIARLRATPTR
jgi:hypothetical protein